MNSRKSSQEIWTVFVTDLDGHSSPHIEHGTLPEVLQRTADLLADDPSMFGDNEHGQPAFRIEAQANPYGTKWANPTGKEAQ